MLICFKISENLRRLYFRGVPGISHFDVLVLLVELSSEALEFGDIVVLQAIIIHRAKIALLVPQFLVIT